MIALLCGIKISATHHLVLLQSTRVTNGQTDRQIYDSQDCPRICLRGKNCKTINKTQWAAIDGYNSRLL